jgi:hypothetical protein
MNGRSLSSPAVASLPVTAGTPLCIHCGRPTRLTGHGWGHCVVFARTVATDQHRAAPSRHMAALYALRQKAEL